MRISVILLITGMLHIYAEGYSQETKLSLEANQAGLKEVIKQIETQSEFLFLYNAHDIDDNIKVDINVRNRHIDHILDILLNETGLEYIIVDRHILLRPNKKPEETGLPADENILQRIAIIGTITDEKDEPLPGVNVVIKGTLVGTVTDIDGKYTITVPDKESVLVFSFIGYMSQEVNIGERTVIDIILNEDVRELEEIVVVGYGVQKKENLTGAVSMVNMEKTLGDRPVTSIAAALQGAVPGLVITGNAIPGTSKTFNIRGTTSINGGEPLILVDNVPADIDLLNPEDIESISVLKDAASAAIYGARGAFGVILITTKKAKKNSRLQLNYNNNFGFIKSINRPEQASITGILETFLDWDNDGKYYADGQNLRDWIGYVKEYNANPSAFPENGLYIPEGEAVYYYLKDNDPQGSILDNFGFQQTHNISANGGSEKIVYRMSLGYTDTNGVLITDKDKYQRINASSFIRADITSWLTQSLDIRFSKSERSYVSAGGVYNAQIARFYPTGEIVRSNDLTGPAITVNSPENYLLLKDPDKWVFDNPRIFSLTSIRPFKGFEAIIEYTFDKSNWDKKEYNSPFYMTNIQMGLLWSDTPSTGRYRNDKRVTDYNALNIYGTYQFDLKDTHNFKIMAGFSQESRYRELMWSQRDDMINPDMPSLSGATGEIQSMDEYLEYSIRSGFFRVNYDYKGRYLFEANGRYDGSSKFPKKDRFGFFPSFSAGWQLRQEEWMKWSNSWLDELKIRVSWGQVGNQAIGEYAYTPVMEAGRSTWVQNGSLPMTLGMPSLVRSDFTWEKVETTDIGLDFRFLNGRLSGTFDWYQRDTKGMLMPGAEFPSIVGADAPEQNAADLRTRGWEIALNWRDHIGDWGYSIGFNIYDSKSKITKYENAAGLFYNRNSAQDAKRYREGMTLGEIWGYVTDRYYTIDDFEDGGQNDTWNLREGITTVKGNSDIRPGDIMFKNLRDDPDNNSINQIDEGRDNINDPGDRKIIGNETMRYQFGANLGVNWKGFDLSVFLQGTGKRDAWLTGHLQFPLNGNAFGTVYSHQLDYWKPIDKDNGNWNAINPNAEFPRLYDETKNAGSNNRIQTKYLADLSYIRLKNLTLSYRIPTTLVKKINIEGVKVFFSGENLCTWDKLAKGHDPERTGWNYPFYATYSFGINVTL